MVSERSPGRWCQGYKSSGLARFDRASEKGGNNRWRNVGSGRGCRRHDPRLSWWLPWGSRFLQIGRQRSATAVLPAHLRLVSTPGDHVSRSHLARGRWDPAILGLHGRHDRLARDAAARGSLDEAAPSGACRQAKPDIILELPEAPSARSGKLEPRRLAPSPVLLAHPLQALARRVFVPRAGVSVDYLDKLAAQFVGQPVAADEIMQSAIACPKRDVKPADTLTQDVQKIGSDRARVEFRFWRSSLIPALVDRNLLPIELEYEEANDRG
jgi:hypothetical protein